MQRELFETEHDDFRDMVRAFCEREIAPRLPGWERDGIVDRGLFTQAGKLGLLGLNLEEAYGGGGVADFRYNVVLNEELTRVGAAAVTMNLNGFNDLIAPYLHALCTPEQKTRWLPGLCSGELVAAIAMTEPGTGSDLRGIRTAAVRDGAGPDADFVLDGAKTFISNGILADVVVVAARTGDRDGRATLGLFVVERGMPGFTRGAKLDKLGLAAQDTAELFFDAVRVPASHVLGDPQAGFTYLTGNLPQERMSVAVTAVAGMRRSLTAALDHVRTRQAFGGPLTSLQTIRFTLAELATEVEVAQVFLDRCIAALVAGELTDVDAAMAKWWLTELQQRVVTRCLQLHGGYGYMREYGIARDFVDARAATLYAGTTEIMKEIIGRALVR
ncbi:MAG TPA: acyl-CoA dehydrogenase family protein [Actinophytocola sp.]|nr:acyl-CoA dehydrogenase family protein [Actinophytocola sp.]